MIAPAARTPHEAGALKDFDVLRYGVERQVEGDRDVRDSRRFYGEMGDDLPAGVVR